MIGPSGCGKSTLLRVMNRMYDIYPGQRAEGEVLMDGTNLIDRSVDLNALAEPHRHGVPEADAVPDVDLRQHRVRRAAAREAEPGGDGRAGGVVAHPVGAVGGGQGPPQHAGVGAVGRAAAAALHRAHDRHAPRGDPARRADLGARPDLDAQGRGADRRAEARLHHRDRHPQHAAGGALRRPGGVLYLGELVEIAPAAQMFTAPREKRTQDYITGRFG